MSPDEFRAILAALGVSQARLARVLRCDVHTVSRWAGGAVPVPIAQQVLLRAARDGALTMAQIEGFAG